MNDAEARLYTDFAALGIVYKVFEHPPVFTVEESSRHTHHIKGAHTKNLFLKDKAGAFWLVTVQDKVQVDLKALPAAIGSDRVSFGKAEDMERLLGILPGSVTALATRDLQKPTSSTVIRYATAQRLALHLLTLPVQ
jgi:Ala-tRNA(Pro) deacylase